MTRPHTQLGGTKIEAGSADPREIRESGGCRSGELPFEGGDRGRGQAVLDVQSRKIMHRGGVAVDDEFEHLVVLVEIDRAGLVSCRQHQAEAAIAVGFGPQVIKGLDHYVVVRGTFGSTEPVLTAPP
jgi:hypothetical protein